MERCLQAANTRDLDTLSRLFGGAGGAWAGTRGREEVELRMNAIDEILQHSDYEIVSEGTVPGTVLPNRRVGVNMSLSSGVTADDVGFVVVLESVNRWLINTIELTKITEGV